MAVVGNGTTQYISLGTAVTIVQSPPITFAALIDTTSLRAGGVSGSEWNSIIQQGIYQTSGWDVEIENGASNNRLNLSAKATGGVAFDAFGPTVTANTGWWLVAGVLRDTGANLATDLYTYRYNTGALSVVTTATFSRGTNGTLPTPTGLTTLMAQNGTTDWFPGAFGWVAVWNVDLFGAGAANPPALQSLISEGPFSQADSSLKGLWLNDGDVTDYSTGGHNGTLINAPPFIGTPVNYRPLVQAFRTTAPPASGSNPLAGTGDIVTGGAADLSQTDALAGTGAIATGGTGTLSTSGSNPLAGTGAIATGGTAALSQTEPLAGSGAIQTGGTGNLTQTEPLAGTGAIATGGTAALSNTGGGSGTANFAIGVNTAGNGGNDMSPAVVRDSSNRLWRASFTAAAYTNGSGANNGNTLRMFRADQDQVPSSFTEQDAAHRPTNVGSFSIAIDGSDLIHVAFVHTYAASTTGIYYTTFNTTTNLWSGIETKIGTVNYASTAVYTVGDAGAAMALDASGVPHVVSYGQTSGTGATHIFYTNKIGGTWSAAVQLDTATLGTNQRCMHPACMFDSTGALHVAWMTITANYGTTLEHAYYIKRSSGGTFGSVTAFTDNLLGSIDNGPSLYVSEDDHIHIAYGLGDGTNAGGQAVTGTTVNNAVFYRFSSDGGATWNTTTQPAHYVSHDFAIGPDGAGGIHLWSHSQPTTVDGLGTAIGYAALAKGSSSWVAWAQKANAASLGYDCTVSPRREKFFHNRPAYLDLAFFALDLPLSAMLGSDPTGNALVGQTETGAIATGGTATLSTAGSNALAGTGGIVSGGTGNLTQTEPLAGTGGITSGGTGNLSQADALAGSGAIQTGGTGNLTQAEPLAGTGAIQSGGSASLTQTEPLAGTGSVQTGGAGNLTQTEPLAGTGAIQSGGTGALSQTEPLAGSGTITTGGTGALSNVPGGSDPLAGAGAIATGGSGNLSQTEHLAGTGAIATGGTGALTTAVPLAGTGTIQSGGTGALSQTDTLAGTGSIATGGTGALAQTEPLAGSGTIQSGGTAALTNVNPIILGTVTLTDQALATITLTDQALATITLTITDEEGVVMNRYILGNVARLNAIVKDIMGINVDAGTQTVKAKPPLGTFTPVPPTHDATGVYHYDYSLDVPGEHAVRVETTNPQAAAEGKIYVPPSLVA